VAFTCLSLVAGSMGIGAELVGPYKIARSQIQSLVKQAQALIEINEKSQMVSSPFPVYLASSGQ
jgi:hypothetical protein